MFRLTKNTDDFKEILQANDSKDVMNISLKDYVFNNSSKEGTIMFPTNTILLLITMKIVKLF